MKGLPKNYFQNYHLKGNKYIVDDYHNDITM